MKFTLAIVVVLAFAVSASAMVSRSATLRKESAAAVKEIDEAGAAKRLAAELRGIPDDERLEWRLAVLAHALELSKNHAATTALFDELMAGGDLRGAILAGDLLLHRLDAVETSSYGITKSAQTVPAAWMRLVTWMTTTPTITAP